VDVERLRTVMIDLRTVGLISASTRRNEDDDLPAPDFPSKPETCPEFMCVQEQVRSNLRNAIGTLSERYQKVIRLYYTKELTMKEVGGMLGINESRVSQIHKAALEQMAMVLHCNGIDSIHAFQN
jgi:RNA polymerase sigma factor for flagellar operon FliA